MFHTTLPFCLFVATRRHTTPHPVETNAGDAILDLPFSSGKILIIDSLNEAFFFQILCNGLDVELLSFLTILPLGQCHKGFHNVALGVQV